MTGFNALKVRIERMACGVTNRSQHSYCKLSGSFMTELERKHINTP